MTCIIVWIKTLFTGKVNAGKFRRKYLVKIRIFGKGTCRDYFIMHIEILEKGKHKC